MHLTILELILSIIVLVAASCGVTLYFIFRPASSTLGDLEIDIPFSTLLEAINQALANNAEQIVITARPGTDEEVNVILNDPRQQLENTFKLS